MDPVITVLLQAAGAFGGAVLTEAGKRALGEAWDATMNVLKGRLGADHPAPRLAEQLRLAGPVEAEAGPLREQLGRLHLAPDPDLMAAVTQLATALEQQRPGGPTVHANLIKGAGLVMGNQVNHFD